MQQIISTGDLSILTPEQMRNELMNYGIAMKNKTNKKLYERLLLEIYSYKVKGSLPDYL
jgi:hypothetical protein